MKALAFLVIATLGCSLAQAKDEAQPRKPTRMATCQKEATASGKKGDERQQVLRTCLAAAKAGGKIATKPA